ncbi:MAG TPA: decaprenyl-phosphate phosphoribosyltransferase [bacterium]|nr:decaprenyl-phosphate phosphoribosyltransferase [bacterium]HOL46680.1 decaprenyl-phosphate phosphoribosyltransferase [bacterium]
MIKIIFQELRYYQWLKNLLVFSALFFSGNIFNIKYIIITIFGFIVFCLLSSCVYIINDIIDIEKDKLHPQKKLRPIASGKLKIIEAIFLLAFLFSLILVFLTYLKNFYFTITALIYFFMMVAYSLYFKNIIIADVIVIALGFILRAISGAELIKVEISNWLVICTFLLALFLALGKRRSEIINLGEIAINFKKILSDYNIQIIDYFLTIVGSTIIFSYILYAFDERTVSKLSYNMRFSIPFVVYGILRYFFLIQQNKYTETPEIIIIKDKPTLINLCLWVLSILFILYFKN